MNKAVKISLWVGGISAFALAGYLLYKKFAVTTTSETNKTSQASGCEESNFVDNRTGQFPPQGAPKVK